MRSCSVEGCERKYRAKGFCSTHYNQFNKSTKTCSLDGCARNQLAKGLCSAHYQQQWAGKPLGEIRSYDPERGCSFEGCHRPHARWGLCRAHGDQKVRGSELKPIRVVMITCSVEGCEQSHHAKSFCANHYARVKYHDPVLGASVKQYTREYQKAHPHILREQAHRRRARLKNSTVITFTQDQLMQRLSMFSGRCGICGETLVPTDEIHVDHRVPIARGGPHCLSNLQPAHASCNLSKGARYVA